MNRQEAISQTLLWESVAKKAKERAQAIRDQLAEEARAELEREGTAPTWRLPDIGTVTLPVSQESVYVADEQALLEWVKRAFPAEVETLERVRPAFQAALLAVVEHDQGRVFITEKDFGQGVHAERLGEEVPGLAVRPGGQPMALSFRPSRDAKAIAADYAETLIGELEQQLGGGS